MRPRSEKRREEDNGGLLASFGRPPLVLRSERSGAALAHRPELASLSCPRLLAPSPLESKQIVRPRLPSSASEQCQLAFVPQSGGRNAARAGPEQNGRANRGRAQAERWICLDAPEQGATDAVEEGEGLTR